MSFLISLSSNLLIVNANVVNGILAGRVVQLPVAAR
jgi:hypothetical protein